MSRALVTAGNYVSGLAGAATLLTTIVSVDPKAGKAVVEGVNVAIRHTRQSAQGQGGRLPKAMPIDLSNLALLDKAGKPTRVGFRFEDGKKVRFAKTTGEAI